MKTVLLSFVEGKEVSSSGGTLILDPRLCHMFADLFAMVEKNSGAPVVEIHMHRAIWHKIKSGLSEIWNPAAIQTGDFVGNIWGADVLLDLEDIDADITLCTPQDWSASVILRVKFEEDALRGTSNA